MEEKEKTITIKIPSLNIKKNFWKILSIILLVALVGSMYVNLTGKAILTLTQSQNSANEIGKKVVDFINNNLVQPGTSASLISVKDMGSYFEILTSYQGQQIPVYASKDGKILFLQAIDMTQQTQRQTQAAPQQQTQEIPKKDRPDMKVFIMSYCPYGLQAIKALLPVMKLLGGKADISVHYVYYAMHGEKEVYENLRQYCIQKEQRDKFYDYMLCFVQSGDYQKCLNEAKVDVNKLNVCMNETDKKYNVTKDYQDRSTWLSGAYPLFLVEKDLNDKYGVQGSPTIIINDKEVSLSRSPEAFKQAICQAFTTPPTECNQKLSTETASPGIGPLTGGSSSSGSCG
jgi:glutaredoxin